MKHVIGAFEKRETAEAIIQTLSHNIPRDRISLITTPEQIPNQDETPRVDLPINGGFVGAAIGGALGLTFAAGSAMMPGGTPLMVGWGPLFGILYGGMSGGVLGGLVDMGINPTSAKKLSRAVESGSILVSAEIHEDETNEVIKLMREYGADHIAVQD